jgi:hypothetical protein
MAGAFYSLAIWPSDLAQPGLLQALKMARFPGFAQKEKSLLKFSVR